MAKDSSLRRSSQNNRELQELYKHDAVSFSEDLLEYENGKTFENPWHINVIYDILDNKLTQLPSTIDENGDVHLGKIVVNRTGKINRRVAAEVPRNHAKSTAVSVNWTLKEVYKDPNIRFVIASNSASQSTSFLREIVSHIERGDKLNEAMGSLKPDQPEKWTQTEVIVNRTTKKKDPTISTVGAGGTVLSKRADIVILDDLLNPENTKTPEARAKVDFWVNNVLRPIIEPVTGRQIVIGTVWYKGDYLDERMRDTTFDVRLQLRALIKDSYTGEGSDHEHAMDIREVFDDEVIELYGINATEGVLWPERWPLIELLAEKEISGSVAFNRQYMNVIISEEEQIIKTEWLTAAKQRGAKFDFLAEYKPENCPYGPLRLRTAGVDLAISQKSTADWTVDVTIGQDAQGMIYILNGVRDRFSPANIRKTIVDEYYKFTPQKVIVENVAFQESLRKDMADNTDIPVEGYTTGGEKYDEYIGINSVGVLFENGKIVLPYNYEKNPALKVFIDRLVYECEAFGLEGHTGDILMAFWFAIQGLRSMQSAQEINMQVSSVGFYSGRNRDRMEDEDDE
jgi:hypothetical protein